MNIHSQRPRTGRPVRTPTVIQSDALGCGAAVLGIILGYHGRWLSMEQLRKACGVSRDGVRASQLLRAARDQGLLCRGFKAEPGRLHLLPQPSVLHWRFSHFVVFEGFTRRGLARINDPAEGRRTVSRQELDECMTGIVVAFRPGPEFKAAGSPPSPWPALRRQLRGAAPSLALASLIALLLAIPAMLSPALSRVFVDRVLVQGEQVWLPWVLAGLLLTAAIAGTLTWLQQGSLLRLENELLLRRTGRFLWHLLHLPLEALNQRFTGDLVQRVHLHFRLAGLLSNELARAVLAACMALALALFMLRTAPLITLLCLVLLSLNASLLLLMAHKRREGNARLLHERAKLSSTAHWGLELIESLKASASEGDLFRRWAGHQTRVLNVEHELEVREQWLGAAQPLISGMGTAAILGFGGQQVLAGQLSLGQLIALQLLATAMARPVAELVGFSANLQLARGELDLLEEMLASPTVTYSPGHEPPAPPVAQPPSQGDQRPRETSGLVSPAVARCRALSTRRRNQTTSLAAGRPAARLELCGLDFGYREGEPPLLRDLNLKLEAGAWAALVGRTGSGKTTLTRLVTGLYQPWHGQIRLDGEALQPGRDPRRLRLMATVDQDIFTFAGTVREHLSLWDPSLCEEQLRRAARDATILEEILARPGAFDSPVAEGGINWSGGQLQRLEIARALARDPALLVLDEATSNLDAESEVRVMANLRRRGCTCLLVAHRLSTVRDADQILVMDGGRIVERGSHEELMDRGGLYRDLAREEAP